MTTLELRSTILVLSLSAACIGAPRTSGPARVDASTITEEQLASRHYQNLYEAVHALRSNWLSTRGADSFRAPSQVWVYMDHQRFGGVETLSSIATQGVTSITHLSGIDATARYGLGHSAGVISVHTLPNRSAVSPERSPAPRDSAAKRAAP
jgi:hypothetical protein